MSGDEESSDRSMPLAELHGRFTVDMAQDSTIQQAESSDSEEGFWCRRFTFGSLCLAVDEEFGAGLGGTVSFSSSMHG
jgi:hypothetical protein